MRVLSALFAGSLILGCIERHSAPEPELPEVTICRDGEAGIFPSQINLHMIALNGHPLLEDPLSVAVRFAGEQLRVAATIRGANNSLYDMTPARSTRRLAYDPMPGDLLMRGFDYENDCQNGDEPCVQLNGHATRGGCDWNFHTIRPMNDTVRGRLALELDFDLRTFQWPRFLAGYGISPESPLYPMRWRDRSFTLYLEQPEMFGTGSVAEEDAPQVYAQGAVYRFAIMHPEAIQYDPHTNRVASMQGVLMHNTGISWENERILIGDELIPIPEGGLSALVDTGMIPPRGNHLLQVSYEF